MHKVREMAGLAEKLLAS